MNKTIWILWLQGWDNAPNIAQKCVESWKFYNPNWDIKLLDSNTVKDYLPFDDILPGLDTNNISYSDIIRLCLLKYYGGVWADSTVFCNKPLDDWIPKGTFLFDNPSKNRMIANWFIKSEESSNLMEIWYTEMIKYWKYRIKSTDQFYQDYGWPHRIFSDCYSQNFIFREEWDSCVKMTCNAEGMRGLGPHYFVPYEKYFYEELTENVKSIIDLKIHPIYKLSYKINTDWKNKNANGIHPLNEKIEVDFLEGGSLDYLLKTIGD